MLYCTKDRSQHTGEISHFIKALRLRQLRVKLISRVVKGLAIPFSHVSADSFRVNIQECSRSLYAFIAFRQTCFARCLVLRNLHETLSRFKNNSRRITYGIGRLWGMPSLSPLSKRNKQNKMILAE